MHSQKVSKSQGGVYKFWRTLVLCSVSDQAPRSKVERPTLLPFFAKNSCWGGYAFHFPESARSILPYLNNNEREGRVLGNRILFLTFLKPEENWDSVTTPQSEVAFGTVAESEASGFSPVMGLQATTGCFSDLIPFLKRRKTAKTTNGYISLR